MKITVYVLTDGASPSLHRRLLQAELKIDERGASLSEISRHQGFDTQVTQALGICLSALPGAPVVASEQENLTAWGEGGAVPG